MAVKAEIDKAIAAHGKWKVRLKQAIDTGTFEGSVESIADETGCEFGKWLFGRTLSPTDKADAHYNAVKQIHTEFHKAAVKVVKLALAGKKDEANKMMAYGGEFTIISGKLTTAMIDWKKSLE